MSVIPVAIVIGIIEDKIANDLSSEDNKNKIIEHLEDIKKKIKKNSYKPTTKKINILFKNQGEALLEVEEMKFLNNFLYLKDSSGSMYYNSDEIISILDKEV